MILKFVKVIIIIIIVISILWYFFVNKKNKFNGGAYRFNSFSHTFKDIFGREIQLSLLVKTDYLNIYKAESIKSEIINIYKQNFNYGKQGDKTKTIISQCLDAKVWNFVEPRNLNKNYCLKLTDDMSIKLEKGLNILLKYYFLMFKVDDKHFNSYDLGDMLKLFDPVFDQPKTLMNEILTEYEGNVPYLSIDERHTFVIMKIIQTLEKKYENILYDQFGVDPKCNFLTSSNVDLIDRNVFKTIVEKENKNKFKLKIIETTSDKKKIYSDIINILVIDNDEIIWEITNKFENYAFNNFDDMQKIIYEIYENYFSENYPQFKTENENTESNEFLQLLYTKEYEEDKSEIIHNFMEINGIDNYNSLMSDLCKEYYYVFNNAENITDYLKFSTLLFVLFYDLNNFKELQNYGNIKREFINERKKYLPNYDSILLSLINSNKYKHFISRASTRYCNTIMDLTNKIIAYSILSVTDFNHIVFLSEIQHNRTINENRDFFKNFDKTEIRQSPGLLTDPVDTRHIEYQSIFEDQNNLKMITYYNIDERSSISNIRFSLTNNNSHYLINWPSFNYKTYANIYYDYKNNSNITYENKKIVKTTSIMTLIMTLIEIIGNIGGIDTFRNRENYNLKNKLNIFEKYISNDFKLDSDDEFSLLYSICPNVFYRCMNLPNLIGVLTKILFVSDYLLSNSKSYIENPYFILILTQFRKIIHELFNLYLTEPKKMEQWPDINFYEGMRDTNLIFILTKFLKQNYVSDETVNLFNKIMFYNKQPYYYILIIYIMYYCSLLLLFNTNFETVKSSMKNYIYDYLENYYYKRDLVVVDDLDSYLDILIEKNEMNYKSYSRLPSNQSGYTSSYYIYFVSYLFKNCHLNTKNMCFLCDYPINIGTLKMDAIGLYKIMKYPFLLEHTNELNPEINSLGKTLYIFFGGSYHGQNYYDILRKFYGYRN